MMNYKIFKEMVKERFLAYMLPEYANCSIGIQQVTKVNKTVDCINLIQKYNTGNAGYSASPNIYIDTMYEHYKECGDLHEVLRTAADAMVHGLEGMMQIVQKFDFDTAKDNIIFQLVNTKQNKEMLCGVPHRTFQDLSIIYRWIIEQDSRGNASTIVHNGLAEKLNVDEESLFAAAEVNTEKILPPVVKKVNEIMHELYVEQGLPEEVISMFVEEMPEDMCMYVISNDMNYYGAASMLNENILHKLAEKLQSDLYIMPSSIHEVIAISTNAGTPNTLAQMVTEINMNEVSLEERLSNQVYHYDKDLRTISQATDGTSDLA